MIRAIKAKRAKKQNIKYLIFQFIIGSVFIFYQFLPSVVVALLAVLYLLVLYAIMRKRYSRFSSLVITCVASIPISFISILGGSTSSFPFAMFHIITMLLALMAINRKGNLMYLGLIALFAIFGFTASLTQPIVEDGLKQIVGIIFCMLGFYIGSALKNSATSRKVLFFDLTNTFIASCLVVVVHVLVQFVLYRFAGLQIGHMIVYAQRIAYGGLMGDYSFATLYLACGFFLTFLLWARYKKLSFIKLTIIGLPLTAGMLIVSSRTGLAALLITLVLYFLFTRKRFSFRTFALVALGVVAAIIVLTRMQALRGAQSLLDSSGRIEGYLMSLQYFMDYPVFGVGLGLTNLFIFTGLGVPHNFFIQYLCQVGFVGTLVICLPFIVYTFTELNTSKYVKWVFILIFIGSMLIPDITSSRFLFAIIIISFLEPIRKNNKVVRREVYRKQLASGGAQ